MRFAGFSLVFTLGVWGVQAEGVHFANDLFSAVVNPVTGERVTAADGFLAALYHAPSGQAPLDFVQVGQSTAVAPVPVPQFRGLFDGGIVSVPEVAPGGTLRLQVRIWESRYGATFEAAQAAPAMDGRTSVLIWSGVVTVPQTDTNSPAAELIDHNLHFLPVPPPAVGFALEPADTAVFVGGELMLWADLASPVAAEYWWRKGGETLTEANTNQLVVGEAMASDSGEYQLVVWNQADQLITSRVATVTVKGIPILVGGEMGPDGFHLLVEGEVGDKYEFEGTTNLTDWVVVGSLTNSAGGMVEFIDSALLPKRVYRMLARP